MDIVLEIKVGIFYMEMSLCQVSIPNLLRGNTSSTLIKMLFVSLLFISLTAPGLSMPTSGGGTYDVLHTLTKKTVSPDNSCGGSSEYICPTGQCCSQYDFWYAAAKAYGE